MSALDDVRDDVSDHMDAILKNFQPGAKITVLVRFPEHPTRDFVLTSDNLSGAIEALERQKADHA